MVVFTIFRTGEQPEISQPVSSQSVSQPVCPFNITTRRIFTIFQGFQYYSPSWYFYFSGLLFFFLRFFLLLQYPLIRQRIRKENSYISQYICRGGTFTIPVIFAIIKPIFVNWLLDKNLHLYWTDFYKYVPYV